MSRALHANQLTRTEVLLHQYIVSALIHHETVKFVVKFVPLAVYAADLLRSGPNFNKLNSEFRDKRRRSPPEFMRQ